MSWIDHVYTALSNKTSGDCNSAGLLAGPDGTVWAEYEVGAETAAADAAAMAAMAGAVKDGSWGGQSLKLSNGKFMIMGVEDIPGTSAKLLKSSKMGGPGADGTTIICVAYSDKSIIAGYNKEAGQVAIVNSAIGVVKGATNLANLGY